jgi:hypothetical protein
MKLGSERVNVTSEHKQKSYQTFKLSSLKKAKRIDIQRYDKTEVTPVSLATGQWGKAASET